MASTHQDRSFLQSFEEEEFSENYVNRNYSDENGQDSVNYTSNVQRAVESMPAGVDYYRCINCWHPVAFADEVTTTIYANRHPGIQVAHVIRMFPYSLPLFFTVFENLSRIYWKTHVRCLNCRIFLSIPALNTFNVGIDEYSSDGPCVILDAGSFELIKH